MKWIKYGLIGLFSVIALGVLVLLALGRRADRGRSVVEVEIARPPAVVWQWIEDPEKFKRWVSWVVEVRDSGPNGVGGRRTTVMKDPNMNGQLVTLESEVRERIDNRRMVVAISSPLGFSGTVAYDFEDLGNGRTRLRNEGHWQYGHWFASLMEPLVTPQVRAKGLADFQRLKELAEAAP